MRRLLPLLGLLSLAFAPAPLPRSLPSPPRNHGIEFRMENKRLGDVFRWLSERTGKPFIGSCPVATFTFGGPKAARYSIPEIVYIINRDLVRRGFPVVLIERERCFAIVYVEDIPLLAS